MTLRESITPAPALADESTPVPESSPVAPGHLPEPATSTVSDYFDLDEEVGRAVPIAPDESRSIGTSSPPVSAFRSPLSALPIAPAPAPVPYLTKATDTTLRDAEQIAGLCREFDRLLATGHHSLRTAARHLGKAPSYFSGADSAYARYRRHGVAGLVPKVSANKSTFPIPAWFIPAAKFFYLLTNRDSTSGSLPEAVRRTISLPAVPFGWTSGLESRLLSAINASAPSAPLRDLPTCPDVLRELILSREKSGKPLVPPSIARQIIVNKSVVTMHRNPRDWSLNNQSAPGSQRRYTNKLGQRQIMQPGDWFGGDDATPGIAVTVPCNEVNTPCSQKYGVLLGRFQWLAFHDARTDKILAFDYVVRPRGSYRAEDILNGMGAVTRTHGIPNQGWQFEGGTFNSKLVRESIRLMGCDHWRTYSPHQKSIESVFNRVWTRLAVQFPHADMGRYRGENEANCKIYEACKTGGQDPRRHFPTIEMVVTVFEEEVAAHNAKRINSEQYGQWIPDDLFAHTVNSTPLRVFSPEMQWMFSPYAAERKVRGMMVRCRVPMFENFSVPFEFGAPWLPLHDGKAVRIHFNPREPKCIAKVVLMENSGARKAGEVLGDAPLIGETAGHIRFILDWGQDDQRAGYLARQKTAQFVRRETRAIGVGGRIDYAASTQTDGVKTVARIPDVGRVPSRGDTMGDETFAGSISTGSGDPQRVQPRNTRPVADRALSNDRVARSQSPPADGQVPALEPSSAARRAALKDLETQTANLFI